MLFTSRNLDVLINEVMLAAEEKMEEELRKSKNRRSCPKKIKCGFLIRFYFSN